MKPPGEGQGSSRFPERRGRGTGSPVATRGDGGAVAAAAVMMNRFRKWLYKPKVSCEQPPSGRRCSESRRFGFVPRSGVTLTGGKLKRGGQWGTWSRARRRGSVRTGASAREPSLRRCCEVSTERGQCLLGSGGVPRDAVRVCLAVGRRQRLVCEELRSGRTTRPGVCGAACPLRAER